jgi:Kef-type K+ transport system membrane component KefB
VLGLAEVTEPIDNLSSLGLSFLMFLAGYETDINRIKGRPLNRAALGWLLTLVIAMALAAFLVFEGFALSTLLIGLCLTTTALGTLLPILSDAKVLETPFGSFISAIGTVGEFAPIVAIALLLTSDNPGGTAVLLVVFVALAAGAMFVATRPKSPRVLGVLSKHLHSSAQLPIRISVLLIVGLVWVASELGLDVLLGAFTAGIVIRLFSPGDDADLITTKLEAIGFGFLIPIFFVVTGMNFDIDALTSDVTTLLRVPLFLAFFLVARGVPALLLYRRDLSALNRSALAFLSATALPLVVVITSIGLDTGRMKPENAAALVGAGMLSVLLFPLIGLALRRKAEAKEPELEPDAGSSAP